MSDSVLKLVLLSGPTSWSPSFCDVSPWMMWDFRSDILWESCRAKPPILALCSMTALWLNQVPSAPPLDKCLRLHTIAVLIEIRLLAPLLHVHTYMALPRSFIEGSGRIYWIIILLLFGWHPPHQVILPFENRTAIAQILNELDLRYSESNCNIFFPRWRLRLWKWPKLQWKPRMTSEKNSWLTFGTHCRKKSGPANSGKMLLNGQHTNGLSGIFPRPILKTGKKFHKN